MDVDRKEIIRQFGLLFHEAWDRHRRTWMGVHIIKYPTDLFIYQMIIHDLKPDVIIETGSYKGGGALFFASMCELVGHGHVLSIDRRDLMQAKHPRLTQFIGRGTSDEMLARVREFVGEGSCMVVLDSNHETSFVKRELVAYGPIVTVGQYLVVEDTYLSGRPLLKAKYMGNGPYEAVQWFLKRTDKFEPIPWEESVLVSSNPGGYLRKVRA